MAPRGPIQEGYLQNTDPRECLSNAQQILTDPPMLRQLAEERSESIEATERYLVELAADLTRQIETEEAEAARRAATTASARQEQDDRNYDGDNDGDNGGDNSSGESSAEQSLGSGTTFVGSGTTHSWGSSADTLGSNEANPNDGSTPRRSIERWRAPTTASGPFAEDTSSEDWSDRETLYLSIRDGRVQRR